MFFLLAIGAQVVPFYTDWLWFGEVGYTGVFWTTLSLRGALFTAVTVGVLVFLGANLMFAARIAAPDVLWELEDQLGLPGRVVIEPLIRRFLPIVLLMISIVSGLRASVHWEIVLGYQNAELFGATDPVFGQDLGFFVFVLPFWRMIHGWAMALAAGTMLLTLVLYGLQRSLVLTTRGPRIAAGARTHLLLLGALLLLLKAVGFWLDRFEIVFSERGFIFGAAYTDVYATLPALGGLALLAVLAAVACMAQIGRPGLYLVGYGLALLAVAWVVGLGAYPALLQRFRVAPNELAAERPFIEHNIRLTRAGLRPGPHPGEGVPGRRDARRAGAVAQRDDDQEHPAVGLPAAPAHLRPAPGDPHVLQVRGRGQRPLRDQRRVPPAHALAARALLPASAGRAELDQRAPDLHPRLRRRGGPGHAHHARGAARILRQGHPAPVQWWLPRDHPAGDLLRRDRQRVRASSALARRSSTTPAAIRTSTPATRDAAACRSRRGCGGWPSPRASASRRSSSPTTSPRRAGSSCTATIAPRIQRIAPFFRFDRDPYLVVTDAGRLVWMMDGYTTTDRYPYSEPVRGIGNYMRNSVKVTVDAYDGVVTFYVADATDPIVRTYARGFPGLLKPLAEMPADLQRHIRYPEDFFAIQARKYAIYHMEDPQVFYNKEDLWAVPRRTVEGRDREMEPYFTIMRLPGESKEEFILLTLFNPSRRDNMIAWLAARSDPPNYGRLVVYNFPKQKLVYGPRQIDARIDQDPIISQQLALWNQRGSTVIRGSLLAIPLEQSLIYVQPLYLAASEQGALPELRRVIVAYGNLIAMEPTLEQSLARIFGSRTPPSATAAATPATPGGPAPPATAPSAAERVMGQRAWEAWTRSQEALRRGDWAAYGAEQKQLEEALRALTESRR